MTEGRYTVDRVYDGTTVHVMRPFATYPYEEEGIRIYSASQYFIYLHCVRRK